MATALSSSTGKRLSSAFLGLPVAIGAGLFAATPAGAQEECGPLAASVTCGPGAYDDGIAYFAADDFELIIESGANTGRRPVPSEQDGVHVDGGGTGHLRVVLEDGVVISTLPEGGDGVQVHATGAGGSVEIISGANIAISTNVGGDPSEADNAGLFGWVSVGDGYVAITQNGGSLITVSGVGSGIWGNNEGTGDVTLVSHGTIEGDLGDVWGIYGTSRGGNISITHGATGHIRTDAAALSPQPLAAVKSMW